MTTAIEVPVHYAHLRRMSDGIGLFEHAAGDQPRREHGYCVDDVARGLVVLARDQRPNPDAQVLLPRYLDFVVASQAPSGLVRNRRAADGTWTSRPSVGDWWGRAIWGLGYVAARARDEDMRQVALRHAERGLHLRPPWVHSMAFAALGAAEIAWAYPGHRAAEALLRDAAEAVGSPGPDSAWRWPRPYLTYANGALVEVLVAAGDLLPGTPYLDDGLLILDWLLAHETLGHHLSVTPVGGVDRTARPPGFDQQPIEVAALADACARAHQATGDGGWVRGVDLAMDWFLGRNDSGIPMYDAQSGAGFDGLKRGGRNENRGAESTLAALATMLHQFDVAYAGAPA